MKSIYKSLLEWKKVDQKAYVAARKRGILDDICKKYNWIRNTKKPKKWTKELCISESLKYDRRGDWLRESCGSYCCAKKNGWFDDCVKHMICYIKWTKEKCKEEALKYNTKTEWLENSGGSYRASIENGWCTECTKHMILIKPKGYWTKEKCKEEALKYDTKTEFQKNQKVHTNIL